MFWGPLFTHYTLERLAHTRYLPAHPAEFAVSIEKQQEKPPCPGPGLHGVSLQQVGGTSP